MNEPFAFMHWSGEYHTETVCWLSTCQKYWVRQFQLFSLEDTNVASTQTLLWVMWRQHTGTFHVGSLSFSESLLLPLLIRSIGEIGAPSASSQELFSAEKVNRGKSSSLMDPLRHRWPSRLMRNVCVCATVADRTHVCSIVPLFIAFKAVWICHCESLSCLAFVSEINRSGYHTPVLSPHICCNNRQQMGNKGFNIHTLSGRLLV